MAESFIRKLDPVGSAEQSEKEECAYEFDWSINGTPSTPECILEIEETGVDVTLTNMPGTATIVNNSVITPLIIDLDRNVKYRLRCFVVLTGDATNSKKESFAFIYGKR